MSKPWPEFLYHYTSSHVLLSVLRNRSIWLGSRRHLNDFNEGQVFVSHLRSYAKTEKIKDDIVEAVIAKLDSLECYVNCMTSEGDLLSQWRGYAANGAGVSIGFKSATLVNVIGGNSISLLQKVNYADEFAELNPETQKLVDALLKSNGNPKDDFVQSFAKVRWAVKNKAFEEEEEYRLILTPPSDTPSTTLKRGATATRNYRACDTGVREYYELSFKDVDPNDLIEEITLGPKNTSDLEAVGRLLHDMGFTKTKVHRSRASYR